MTTRTHILGVFFLCLAGVFFHVHALQIERAAAYAEHVRIESAERDNYMLRQRIEKMEQEKKNSMTLGALTYPLKEFNATLTQGYGQNLLAYGGMGLKGHPGVDFATPEGTPVYAAHDGIVFEAYSCGAQGTCEGYGKRVKLRKRAGSKGEETVYAHLSEVSVSVGDFVEDGQLIGYTGNTGFSSRPHLHFGIRFLWYCDKGGKQVGKPCEVLEGGNGFLGWVDPMPYLK